MKKITVTSMILLTLSMQNVLASTAESMDESDSSNVQNQVQKTWLGASLVPVPDVLFKQLSGVMPNNQGIMIQSVTPDSPALNAGLQSFDILLRFNDQQLYTGQQLSGLVASSKPDTEVTLTIIRDAAIQDIKVKLGLRSVASPAPGNRHPFLGFNLPPEMPQGVQDYYSRPFPYRQPSASASRSPMSTPGESPSKSADERSVMQQFESIIIKGLDGDRFHAEVEYQENNGEKKKFTFEGSQEEIHQQIQDNKEFPDNKKSSLLNAIKTNPKQLMSDGYMSFTPAPTFPVTPSFNGHCNTPSWSDSRKKL